MAQVSHPADLCLHSQITQIVHHKIPTTQTQQQCTMRSQLGNVKTKLLACRHHPDILDPQGLPPLLRQQIKRLQRLEEPKLCLHHPLRSLHLWERHRYPLQQVTHIGRQARVNQIAIKTKRVN